ncbi:DUF6338 family protein [Pseudomonas aeruginosa]|jgi:hypothetical protein|uniref:DUF6338 family protein n=1 Tax=Pseudomonas aeruginosa TaxID=287 RepID=UPI0029C07019|nr:DUF6338 family protein [Pseudomonas aeruginosa]HEK0835488.1 hypothetical protein [Pseudomonas aeruginosa]HEK0923675.1 hypothetical protein [Pseudomonas aeruginosa]HEK2251228.1 hypothetical protein [Pseudomonas aeruginosa]HEK2279497.1 hypothetical protein [Pseudomonas aeruginosa]
MEDLAKELIPLVQFLLPGFLITTIFYWLSDSPKPGQFERTLQALIGTTLINLVLPYAERGVLWVGSNHFSLGPWGDSSATGLSIVLAVVAGLFLAWTATHDFLYRLARVFRLTTRAAHSEWVYAFRTRQRNWVVLHLLDGRRLIGYPEGWPTDPDKGYFLMAYPRWCKEDGEHFVQEGINSILVKNTDVYWVEILNEQVKADDGSKTAHPWWQFWKGDSHQ